MQISLFPKVEALGIQKLVWCQTLSARVPWPAWAELVAPYYESEVVLTTACCPLEVMLRIHFVQKYLGLDDLAMVCVLKDQVLMRKLVGLLENEGEVPDEWAIIQLRHLLKQHRLTEEDLDFTSLLV